MLHQLFQAVPPNSGTRHTLKNLPWMNPLVIMTTSHQQLTYPPKNDMSPENGQFKRKLHFPTINFHWLSGRVSPSNDLRVNGSVLWNSSSAKWWYSIENWHVTQKWRLGKCFSFFKIGTTYRWFPSLFFQGDMQLCPAWCQDIRVNLNVGSALPSPSWAYWKRFPKISSFLWLKPGLMEFFQHTCMDICEKYLKLPRGYAFPQFEHPGLAIKKPTPVKHPQLCVKTPEKLGAPTLKPRLERCWACCIGSNRVSSYRVHTFRVRSQQFSGNTHEDIQQRVLRCGGYTFA